ncbi:ribonuclease Z [Virgibacillus sp. DJP39]|uniref:ribonuclease Z n=1 Tax=Virgibacillus sp. DJP39 TaxID=3409790 RepID=UPI003BB507F8
MELIFLGTGSGVPSKERNVSSLALTLLQEQNSIWLFDCGESTQHQILRTPIRPRKINKIFITHLHGDHLFGLPGLLSSRSFQGGDSLLTIYGPKGIKEYVDTSLKISSSHLTYPIEFVELSEGKLFEDDQFKVYSKKLHHGVASYGFRIEEKDKPGELLVEKLKEKGIMPGPIYQQIKEQETTILSNGDNISRKDFLGSDKKGRTLSILGDTRNTEKNAEFVSGSDILVHEATFNHESEHLANEYFHTTTTQAASLAKSGAVHSLILTHISSRYQKKDYQSLLSEARSIFPATTLAHDFLTVHVPNKK